MANNPKLTNLGASAAADAVCALADDGYLRIYDGTQPVTADTAPGVGNHVLAELRLGSPAFGAAVDGLATAEAITPDTSAALDGTAEWFRVFGDDGTTALFDGSVGLASADLIIDSTTIGAGSTVSASGFTYTQSKT